MNLPFSLKLCYTKKDKCQRSDPPNTYPQARRVLGRYAPGTRRASGPVPVIGDVSQEISLYVDRKAALPDPHRHSLLFSHACDALHQVCVQGFACPRSLNINIRKCCIAGRLLFPAPHAQWTAPICLPSIKTRWANGIGRRSDCNDGRGRIPCCGSRGGTYSISKPRPGE